MLVVVIQPLTGTVTVRDTKNEDEVFTKDQLTQRIGIADLRQIIPSAHMYSSRATCDNFGLRWLLPPKTWGERNAYSHGKHTRILRETFRRRLERDCIPSERERHWRLCACLRFSFHRAWSANDRSGTGFACEFRRCLRTAATPAPSGTRRKNRTNCRMAWRVCTGVFKNGCLTQRSTDRTVTHDTHRITIYMNARHTRNARHLSSAAMHCLYAPHHLHAPHVHHAPMYLF